jgi:hypothetical protein
MLRRNAGVETRRLAEQYETVTSEVILYSPRAADLPV